MSDSELKLVGVGPEKKEFLTLQQASKLYSVETATLSKAIERKKLQGVKFASGVRPIWVIERAELERWKMDPKRKVGRPRGAKNKLKKDVAE